MRGFQSLSIRQHDCIRRDGLRLLDRLCAARLSRCLDPVQQLLRVLCKPLDDGFFFLCGIFIPKSYVQACKILLELFFMFRGHIFKSDPGNRFRQACRWPHCDCDGAFIVCPVLCQDPVCGISVSGKECFRCHRRIVYSHAVQIRIRCLHLLGSVIDFSLRHAGDNRRRQVKGGAVGCKAAHIACLVRDFDIIYELFCVLRGLTDNGSIVRPVGNPGNILLSEDLLAAVILDRSHAAESVLRRNLHIHAFPEEQVKADVVDEILNGILPDLDISIRRRFVQLNGDERSLALYPAGADSPEGIDSAVFTCILGNSNGAVVCPPFSVTFLVLEASFPEICGVCVGN